MAGAVFKQCKYKGCRSSPKCKHPWWLSFSRAGRRYRMKTDDFAKQPVASKTKAEQVWLPKFITEIREGRDPTAVALPAAETPPLTVEEFGALDTGMRRGEMLLLQNKHILWSEGLIRIVAPNAKSRKERRIPISTTRLRSVLEQRAFLGPQCYVFGNECGERQVDFRDAWMRILKAARITDSTAGLDGDLRWHDLRHECGSRLADRGVPLHEIQHLLGHASLITTQRYLNTTVESLKKSMKVLEQAV